MPTDDERREVAARLRKHRVSITPYSLVDYIFDDPWRHNRCGDVADRLADLIEPEERTCRDVGGEEGLNVEYFKRYGFMCGACGYCCDLPNPDYCPRCGAKVVEP